MKKVTLLIIAILGWFALAAQLYLIIINRTAGINETIIRYFSFYTILTNILVTVCATSLIINPRTRFFSKTTTLTAIMVYITIVGLVYNIILRQLWNPVGLQRTVDELLHSVIPVLFIVYWFISVSFQKLQWNNIFSWLIYPFIYIIFILIRGAISGFYPYPFIDVTKLRYNKVFLNSCVLLIVFLLFSLQKTGINHTGILKNCFNMLQ